MLAQFNNKVCYLWKFNHNPFTGVGGVAHTRFMEGRTCANLSASTLFVGAIKNQMFGINSCLLIRGQTDMVNTEYSR